MRTYFSGITTYSSMLYKLNCLNSLIFAAVWPTTQLQSLIRWTGRRQLVVYYSTNTVSMPLTHPVIQLR